MSQPAGTRMVTPTPLARKKPYIKPAFRSEHVFETMALSCGKTQTTEGQCTHVIKKS